MIKPFRVDVADEVIPDLRDRLDRWRPPSEIAGVGWAQGTEPSYLKGLIDYWRTDYDWSAQQARLNSFEQFVTEQDGQRIHFLHVPSAREDAMPLLLCHGWPSSVVEFLDVIGPLTNPEANGGDPDDAFSVVVASLPGYTFSGPTFETGWNPRRIAAAFAALMAELGYQRYGVQGTDWGSIVAANLAELDEPHVAGLHLNFVAAGPPPDDDPSTLTEKERQELSALGSWRKNETGYREIQRTRPQTLGFALEDSPAGLAAWIVEKFRAWSDCGGDVEKSFTKDQLLTNIMAYWITRTATSSMRLYYEASEAGAAAMPQSYVQTPTGVARYAAEISRPPRRWVEHAYNVTHWAEFDRGGHFPALEVPDLFVDDVRAFFRTVR